MNVIQFPRGRPSSPPSPTADALLDALATVQIELARARIAQIRSETRQANALWVAYCARKILFWGLVLWLLAAMFGGAKAQNQTTLRDAGGRTIGTATRSGNTVTFRDSRGSTTGTATTLGNQTTYRNSRGSTTGTSTAPRR